MTESELNIGDYVYTTKGCRIRGNDDVLVVTETGKKWGKFPAVKCRKTNGDERLFLVKNIRPLDD